MFNFNKKEKKESQNNKDSQKSTDHILSLSKTIEAILFYKAEEVSVSFLVKFLGVKKEEILKAIERLQENLKSSPIGIVLNNNKALLVVKKEYSNIISELKGEEKSGELSNSALETLAIVLYKGPISKSEIDEIRGVNSSYILRNLLVRGLVERKIQNAKTVYTQTIDLMRFLGIQDKSELPGFEKVKETLNKIENTDVNDVFNTNNSETYENEVGKSESESEENFNK
ncbi:hypothetical protein CSB11_01435 [Candidatus Campbellbacteria bacterium]|nr:MAG: hypothetical protein CSB11_01435 [Candidatus Campbellbacteria bacterium]